MGANNNNNKTNKTHAYPIKKQIENKVMHNFRLIKFEIHTERGNFPKNVNFVSPYTQKRKPLQDDN